MLPLAPSEALSAHSDLISSQASELTSGSNLLNWVRCIYVHQETMEPVTLREHNHTLSVSNRTGEVRRIRLRLGPPPNLAHNLGQAAIAHLKGGGEPTHGEMGHLRRWHLSHAIVTHAKTMQVRRILLLYSVVCLSISPQQIRTAIN